MAFQNEKWQNFYERAWNFRAKFLEKCLGGGCTTIQAISELAKMERMNLTRVNPDGTVEWIPIELAKDEPQIENIRLFFYKYFFGKAVAMPYHSGFNFVDLLVDIIHKTGPYDAIIEFGCGYGGNLFKIFNDGGPRDAQYLGGEFTKSGVEIAKKLAKAEKKMKAKFFHFNHLDPRLKFKPFKRAFVFTCHSIEQVKQINENWFDEVVKAGEYVYGVNLEPFGFQAKEISEVSRLHKDFMIQNTWNLNFFEVFSSAVKRNIINEKNIFLEVSVASDINIGSLAIWDKGNKI